MFKKILLCTLTMMLLFSFTALAQTPPTHTRLLYSDDLTSDAPNDIGEVTNYGGSFTTAGWRTQSGSSQLRIALKDFLPFEGTIEVKVKGFDESNIPNSSDFDWTPISLWSRGTGSFSDVDKTPGSYFMLKTDQGLYHYNGGNTGFKMITAAFFGDKNRKNTYPVAQIDWNPNTEYTFKVIWGRQNGYPDNNMSIWLVVSNGVGQWAQQFEGQIESFGYLLLGKDNEYESIPGVTFRDLKIYGPETNYPFTNMALSTGTHADKKLGGQGVAIADIDGDGHEDIYISQFYSTDSNKENMLFVDQLDGTFNEDAAARGVNDDGWTFSSVFADFDQDGDQDLFDVNYNGANHLYFNNGSGSFTDVSSSKGISSDANNSKSAALIDLENDGDIDIVVVNATAAHKVYVNDGSGNFTAESRGLAGYTGTSEATYQSAVVGDLDGDGYQDIILVRKNGPSLLFINNKSGSFSEQSSSRGFVLDAEANSATLGDIDNDGDLDILVAITASSTSTDPKLEVFRNDGSGNFTRITDSENIQINTFGVVLADWNNDGDLDMFAQRRFSKLAGVFLNDGTGTFLLKDATGAEIQTADGRGASVFDFDNDGFPDIYASSRGGTVDYNSSTLPYSRNYLLRNDIKDADPANANHYLQVAVYNDNDGLGGLGSKIYVYKNGSLNQSSGLLGFREIIANAGYQGQGSWVQHIGVGTNTMVDVKIKLPDGSEKVYTSLPADQLLEVRPTQLVPTKIIVNNCDQQGRAGDSLAQAITVQVLDADDTPVPGVQVDFAITAGNGTLNGDTQQSVTVSSGADGIAAVTWTMGTTAGEDNSLQIAAQYNSIDLDGSPHTCTIVPTANDPAVLHDAGGNGQQTYVGQQLPDPLVVKVTDAYGNIIAGHAVSFDIITGGGTLNESSATHIDTTTDAQGLAQVTWTLGTTEGQQQVNATSSFNGQPLDSSPVQFTATAEAPQQTLYYESGDSLSGEVNKRLDQAFVVKIKNNLDQPVAGAPVEFIVIQGGGNFSGQDTFKTSTNSEGFASAFATLGTAAGEWNNVFQAIANSAAGSPITFYASATHGPAAQFLEFSGNGLQGTAGDLLNAPFVTRVLDAYDNPVEGYSVNFTVTEGNGSIKSDTSESDTSGTVTTDSDGKASAFLRLGTTAGTNTVVFSVSGFTADPITFSAEGKAGNANKIEEFSGNNQQGTAGNRLDQPFKVVVQDVNNNPVAQHDVVFTVTQGGGNIGGQTEVTRQTDENGYASVTLTLGTTAFQNQVEASSEFQGQPLVNSPIIFTATTGPGDPDSIIVWSGNHQKGKINTPLPQPFAVKVQDANGLGIKDHPVQFVAILGGGSFNGQPTFDTTTNDSGIARAKATLGSNIGTDNNTFNVYAKFKDIPLKGSPVSFSASGRKSTATQMTNVSDLHITAFAGTTFDSLKVQVFDADSMPVAEHPVTFERTSSGNSLINGKWTSVEVNSNAQGIATVSVKLDSLPKKTTIRVVSDDGVDNLAGSPITFTIDGITGPPDTTTSTLSASGPVIANGKDKSIVQVTLKDAFLNPVSGKMVTLYTSGLDAVIMQPSDTTDNEGKVSGYIKSINVGQLVVWGEVDTITLPADTVNFTPGPPAKVVAFGSNQIGIKGKPLSNPVGVSVKDSLNHPTPGIPVTFSTASGSGYIEESQPVLTDSAGKAEGTWVLGDLQQQEANARVEGIDDIFTFTAWAQPPGGSTIEIVSGDSLIGLINQVLPDTFVVAVKDSSGNPLVSEKVEFSLFQGDGSFVTSPSVLTDAKGHAYALFKAGTETGLHIVRANATEIGKSVNFNFYIQSRETIQLVKIGEDGQVKRPHQVLTLKVRALDAFSRSLSGKPIAFTVAEGGGSIDEPQPVSTNEDGIASATWTLGTGSTQKVIVKPFDAAGDSVTFSATVINHAPVLSTIPHDTTITVGNTLTIPVSAVDADNDWVSFSAMNLPEGAKFDTTGSVAVFSWTPGDLQTGQYPIIFIATDAFAAADSDTVNVTVYPVGGQCPQIVATNPRADTILTVPVDTIITFSVIATDPLGGNKKYKWYINDDWWPNSLAVLDTFKITKSRFPGDSGYIAVTVSNAVCDTTVRWHIKLLPTSVELSNLQAAPSSDGIQLQWQTRSENSNVGFNVLRSEKANGAYKRINTTILPPRSDGSYHFVDENAQAGVTYYYKLQDIDRSGTITEHGPVSAALALPDKLSLAQNYPNPFNPTTTITFELPQSQQVRLVIYNLSGQIVSTLVNETVRAGVHKVVWNATTENGATVPSGIYYYRLTAGDKVFTKKLLLLK